MPETFQVSQPMQGNRMTLNLLGRQSAVTGALPGDDQRAAPQSAGPILECFTLRSSACSAPLIHYSSLDLTSRVAGVHNHHHLGGMRAAQLLLQPGHVGMQAVWITGT